MDDSSIKIFSSIILETNKGNIQIGNVKNLSNIFNIIKSNVKENADV